MHVILIRKRKGKKRREEKRREEKRREEKRREEKRREEKRTEENRTEQKRREQNRTEQNRKEKKKRKEKKNSRCYLVIYGSHGGVDKCIFQALLMKNKSQNKKIYIYIFQALLMANKSNNKTNKYIFQAFYTDEKQKQLNKTNFSGQPLFTFKITG